MLNHGMPTDAQPICLFYTKHGQCRFGHKCKFTARLAMPTSTLPTSSISPIHNNASVIHITTPVQSTFSQEQLEKVQKHAVQLADVLRKVTAKHHSNVGTDTMILQCVLPSLLEQDCEDCDTSITHKVTSTLHRTIDLDKYSCPQQLAA